MMYQLRTYNPNNSKSTLVATFDNKNVAEIMKIAYESMFCVNRDTCKVIEIKEDYKNYINKAYDSVFTEYRDFLISNKYDKFVSAKLQHIEEQLYELRDFVNYEL